MGVILENPTSSVVAVISSEMVQKEAMAETAQIERLPGSLFPLVIFMSLQRNQRWGKAR